MSSQNIIEPECEICGDEYDVRRLELGYSTCKKHGAIKKYFTIVPVPKSNYIIATTAEQVLSPYSHKGNR